MRSIESKRGLFERGTWGAIVFRNDYGTLETQKVQQGQGTFIGTCLVDGKNLTRKMSGEKYEVCARWEKWQDRMLAEHAKKAGTMAKQEISVSQLDALTNAIKDATKELRAIVEGVNEIWLLMADGKAKAEPDMLAEFLKHTVWLDYINLSSDMPYKQYCAYCEQAGNAANVGEEEFNKAFFYQFADVVTVKDGLIKAVS